MLQVAGGGKISSSLCQWLLRRLLNDFREGAFTVVYGNEQHESIPQSLKVCCLTFNRALGLGSLRECFGSWVI